MYSEGYYAALDFFKNDMITFLKQLTEDEKEHLVMEISLNYKNKIAFISLGNSTGISEHLEENSESFNDAKLEEYDYVEVLNFLYDSFLDFNRSYTIEDIYVVTKDVINLKIGGEVITDENLDKFPVDWTDSFNYIMNMFRY